MNFPNFQCGKMGFMNTWSYQKGVMSWLQNFRSLLVKNLQSCVLPQDKLLKTFGVSRVSDFDTGKIWLLLQY